MIVREALPGEFEAVGDLVVSVYVGGGLVSAESGYVEELRDTARRAARALLLVAVDGAGAEDSGQDSDEDSGGEVDGPLLGTVTYCPGGTEMAEVAGPEEAGFRMLAVDPAARGRGVGEALVRACLDRARAAGAVTMRLSTKEDMHAAHRLYERLGFWRTPALDWSPDPDVKLLTYALDL